MMGGRNCKRGRDESNEGCASPLLSEIQTVSQFVRFRMRVGSSRTMHRVRDKINSNRIFGGAL